MVMENLKGTQPDFGSRTQTPNTKLPTPHFKKSITSLSLSLSYRPPQRATKPLPSSSQFLPKSAMASSASPLKFPNTLTSSTRKRKGFLDLPSISPAGRSRRPSTVVIAGINGHPQINNSGALRVAFQGAPGAYSEFAAKTACPACTTVPCRAFADAIAAVERGRADRAILPVESTMEGTTLRNYDLLLRHDLRIVQEINLFVQYCLLAMPGVSPGELRRVISHPMALAHCGRALAQLGLDREPVEDTAGAVEMLLSNHLLDTAAIASPRAAAIYGLDVLAHGLQDESWNVTRFLLLSTNPTGPPQKPDGAGLKTSLVIAHRGGSMMVLLKVLSAFSKRNINLTKLEVINSSNEGDAPVMILDVRGRGSLKAFPHVLYVDFEGSSEDSNVKEAIDEISSFSVFVRNLGCYASDPNVYDLQ